MLVISLDEYGKFEGEIWRRCLIAGIAFSCDSFESFKTERERIFDYLKTACEKSGAKFPRDLHPLYESGNRIPVNVEEMSRVQEYIERTLPKFFRDAEYNGRYYLYAVVSEPEGVSAFNGKDVGNLLDDNFAGNRYLHMTQMAIRNLAINNPVIQDDAYHMEFATRILPLASVHPGKRSTLIEQAKWIGMNHVLTKDGRELDDFVLTDANSYIATLSGAVMEDTRRDLDFNLKVQSIKYGLDESKLLHQGYMLLADVVCSIMQPVLKEDGDVAFRLKTLADSYTSHKDNMIWCYHDVDFKFRKALSAQINGQWFECLQSLYEICSDDCEQAVFYRDNWVKLLLEKLGEQITPALATEAVRKLSQYLRIPNAKVDECRYIADTLAAFIEAEASAAYNQCRYLLNSSLMTLCNHVSDFSAAESYYRLCEEYAKSAPLDEYLELRNTYSVTLLDRQQYEKALENTKITLQLEELSDNLRSQIYGDENCISVHHGKTLSQMGQCLAFLGRYKEAEECFSKALTAFAGSQVDYQITLSYLLHSYIESKNSSAYAKAAETYFGKRDIADQIPGIFAKDDTSAAFALFVCLKGWYYFTPKNIYTRNAEQILSDIMSYAKTESGHPWELVWKYVVLLGKKYKIKKKDILEGAETALQVMQKKSNDLLKQICTDALISCESGKETSTLPYMYR